MKIESAKNSGHYLNRTTFLTSNEDQKCEKLWTLPVGGPNLKNQIKHKVSDLAHRLLIAPTASSKPGHRYGFLGNSLNFQPFEINPSFNC
jgi:hypothetical protein